MDSCILVWVLHLAAINQDVMFFTLTLTLERLFVCVDTAAVSNDKEKVIYVTDGLL